ncbi:MAG: hypothetical protein GTN76_11445 [Candidatus Aenigmarchaeota archaeon]|nr:hypothetical protein [Candidatus Aenigmarchaeota archaeon]NIQ18042.1 hypothetical protein [Candidatus Aenigmarchaeota archaeon]
MNKAELFNKMNDIISMEDEFIENLTNIDISSIQHSQFKVTTFLRLKSKSGLTKLMDDSRRHKEIISNMITILSGDPRDEY